MRPSLLSIQVGLPRSFDYAGLDDGEGRAWASAIVKEPVAGAVWLGQLGLDGDGQADRAVHGGPNQAVLLYAAEHYPVWRAELDQPELSWGAFGENFTVDGLSETSVCVGDSWAVGDALVQVSQPRRPCWKLGRRHGLPDLPLRVRRTGRGGWYVRVLREGHVAAGEPLELRERPCPEWTIARANDIMYRRERDPTVRAALAACPLLSKRWRAVLSGSGADHA